MTEPTRPFPHDFVWGAATASYQIEGAVAEDGRGPSIWDAFAHTPGRVDRGDTGDVACDHYHRWPADLDLMAELGLPAYRFSISWSRVMPDGRTVNPAGMDFYKRLVDGALTRGITPMATLYHWDLPSALDDGTETGGWLGRDVVDRFVDYAAGVAKELGDRLPAITTLNEPWCSAFLGYATGEHAPGRTSDALALRAAHHLNLAHGRAVTALRTLMPASTRLSVTLNVHQVEAATADPGDREAAHHTDLVANRIFLDPMLRGHYPDELVESTRHLTDWAFVHDGDTTEIGAPLDFLGVNYYNPAYVADPRQGGPFFPGTDRAVRAQAPEGPQTTMGWPIVPSGLCDLLVRLHRDYGLPLVMTENGMAAADVVGADGVVHDADRVAYLSSHLGAVLDAIDAGADVRGYYVWTLLDNFEWAWGYDKRFGIVHVDRETLARTPKDSARWYADVVAAHELPPGLPDGLTRG